MSQPIICEVCNLALDAFTNEDGVTYLHTISDAMDGKDINHEPVPIQAPVDWRGHCDFCTGEVPKFLVPARDFTTPNTPNGFSTGDWAACEWCALLIGTDRWQSVVKRAMNHFQQRMGVPMPLESRVNIWTLYRKLAENITGPIRPIESEGAK
ncbi:hypothetical protein [Saccharopolyspora phatthalungensis]|uniref:Uncharacterized protein n=1 Tax=Saccharopolyspora phatthalungensis TaxID=664693 RepID=A0A840PXH3_9PSEU|nr:hypothetical protein [Saccharopolyspora phatthalungensis]MBB5154982.1 hypothetical protein [Saccharopolyspora phatthalungensis]